MNNEYNRAANMTVIAAGITAAAYLFLKYAVSATLPFLIALLISAAVSSPSKKIAKKLKLNLRATSAFLVITVFIAVATLLSIAIYRLIAEIGNLVESISENPEKISDIIGKITNTLQSIADKLIGGNHPSLSEDLKLLGIDPTAWLSDALRSLISSLTSTVSTIALNIVTKLPETLLFTVTLLLSSYYFCTDKDKITTSLSSLLPEKWSKKLPILKEKLRQTLINYIKAYLSIMLLTFIEIFLGLTLLRVDYAFLISAIVAVVDILPVLGAGTVLIPWAVFSFLTSNPGLGIGLLILYAIVLIVRQIAEPKIVGTTLGIHPLASIASIYVGVKLLGFIGIFIGPIVAILLASTLKTQEKASPLPNLNPKS